MSHITQPNQTMTDEPDKDPTLLDVIEAIDKMSTGIDKRFEGIDKRFEGIDKRFEGIDKRFEGIDERLDHIVTQMVTKPYLDEKLYDLKGDLIVITRKEDRKVDSVVGLLRQKNIFSAQEAAEVLSTVVFPKTVSQSTR